MPRGVFCRALTFSGIATLVAYLALHPAGGRAHWTDILPAAGSVELLVALMAFAERSTPLATARLNAHTESLDGGAVE